MGIENIIKEDMANVNRGIIKKRKPLNLLLSDPRIDGMEISRQCLESIAERCTVPLDEVLIPITFFIPAGLDEGYLSSEKDARVVRTLGVNTALRNGLFWIKKYHIRRLISEYPGCFQMIIIP